MLLTPERTATNQAPPPATGPEKLLVAEPVIGEHEKAALSKVVDSGWITMGERVRAFELAFAKEHGVDDAVAVSSCTAALHLIVDALGLGPGDEVLVPSLSFVATTNCVLYTRATPVFVDIHGIDNPVISLEDAAAKCTPKTKAVIVMNYAGYVLDRRAWREFADSRKLILVEDAAHSAGAYGAGKLGIAAAFSFYGNKNMTTAEGGMVVAEERGLLDIIRQRRGHGMTSGTLQRLLQPCSTYDVTMLGYNYRMDELRAAFGLVQLKNLGLWNAKRRTLTELYRERLSQYCPQVLVPFVREATSAYHIMPVVLPASVGRETVIGAMRESGVQTSVHYPPSHEFSFYRDLFPGVRLPITEEFARRELTLPLHPKMMLADVDRVVETLTRALAN